MNSVQPTYLKWSLRIDHASCIVILDRWLINNYV